MSKNRLCIWCKEGQIGKNSTKYCSPICMNKDHYCDSFLSWYINKENKIGNRRLRQFLETIYGHVCSNCGITEWNGKSIVFDVEHKNGISNHNYPENVCLLCQNCHSQTETYGNSKTGTGRFSLRNKK